MLAEARAEAAPVRERGILFAGEMVRRLPGTEPDPSRWKTQTRRVIVPQPSSHFRPVLHDDWEWKSPYGDPGDRLYVREKWAPVDFMDGGHEREAPVWIAYAADRTAIAWERGNVHRLDTTGWNWERIRWRPSIHMPRWASRITLELTEVRVERVQDISRDDALAEGCPAQPWYRVPGGPEKWFRTLWDRINGPRGYGWERNPWVWALTFKRLEARDGK